MYSRTRRLATAVLLGTALLGASAWAADPRVKFATSAGDILVEVYPDKAPKTVANFLQYVRDKHYDGTIFHRVIPNFMVQAGGFNEKMGEKPARAPIEHEGQQSSAAGLRNQVGTLAMARTGDPHSASAQFFINVKDNTFLDHTAPTARGYGYTVFGKVVGGMDVVNQITTVPTGRSGPHGDVPRTPVVIRSATLVP
ncbi:MAG: Rotamase [Ramlibacter sp.]|jgi:peptidyl-prolyl cis-trans isomerase A (cyclophilin A)|uniref:peptidylprolyl isomerase n=1 Tax=Ramlibacter sp. TaxID=1917967 RepID=UPI0026081739|nr:peptidylprolyl isomerase [Ramlibacter sp.]MDB5753451.1 Rotamase [Ramlibacter sp.]